MFQQTYKSRQEGGIRTSAKLHSFFKLLFLVCGLIHQGNLSSLNSKTLSNSKGHDLTWHPSNWFTAIYNNHVGSEKDQSTPTKQHIANTNSTVGPLLSTTIDYLKVPDREKMANVFIEMSYQLNQVPGCHFHW